MGNDVSLPPLDDHLNKPSLALAISQLITELNYIGTDNICANSFVYLSKFAQYIKDIESRTNSFPVGAIIPYHGTIAPTSWLLCNGELYNKNLYPLLYSILGDNKLPFLQNGDIKFIIKVKDNCNN